ncbi:hypothetical protein MYX82_04545 [Acidobacteria bacterium AH-259-D05]|nr:hypothetical protein [Acidobacteria bacterium AH-259-D05]
MWRLVPVHPTTAEALGAYIQECERRGYDRYCDAFFISEKGTRVNYHVAARTVVALARRLGIRAPTGQRGPDEGIFLASPWPRTPPEVFKYSWKLRSQESKCGVK